MMINLLEPASAVLDQAPCSRRLETLSRAAAVSVGAAAVTTAARLLSTQAAKPAKDESDAKIHLDLPLPDFSSLVLGDRLEFWAGKKVSYVGSIVRLNPSSIVLGYQEKDTAYRVGERRTCRIVKSDYSSSVLRRLSLSEEEVESTETPSASRPLRSRKERSVESEVVQFQVFLSCSFRCLE